MNKILQSTPEQVQDILFIYRNDAEALYQIVKRGGTSPAPLDSIKPEIIAVVTGYIIESVESPGPGEREILKKGYQQGNEDLKNKIRLYLTSKGIVDEYYLSDLWHASIQSRDIQLLQSLVKNTKIKDPDMQKLKNTLPSVTFEQPQAFPLSNWCLHPVLIRKATEKVTSSTRRLSRVTSLTVSIPKN